MEFAGACGQLAVEWTASQGCGGATNSDIEDIAPKLRTST